jgi:hypothetical protein
MKALKDFMRIILIAWFIVIIWCIQIRTNCGNFFSSRGDKAIMVINFAIPFGYSIICSELSGKCEVVNMEHVEAALALTCK